MVLPLHLGQQPGDGRQLLRSDGVLQTSGDLRGQGDNLEARGSTSKKCKHVCACVCVYHRSTDG